MGETFLELKKISKIYDGVYAVKGVDLTVNKGEVHCLAGENGCGKSTVIKIISGARVADEGEVYVEGHLMKGYSPIDMIRKGVQVIYQDFAVFPNLTVAENIAMNEALETNQKVINWKANRKLAVEAMERIGAHIDPDVMVERLTVANKQLVAICRAILKDAKLLILDEPTTALTAKEVDKLFEIIRNLKSMGIAVIIVTHKIDEVYEISDRLTIMRNGLKVITGDIKDFDRPAFVKYMTGREIVDTYYKPKEIGDEILRVEHLTRHGAFRDISFNVRKGDVVAITGLLGSGRAEVGEALFGLQPANSGNVFLHGKKISIKNVDDAVHNKFAYVPEDRLTQGLFLDRSIADNTIASSLRDYFKSNKLDYNAMSADAKNWIKELKVVAQSIEPMVRTLSGGNQQKIVIAKWLNTHPNLLILNGPTVGVDIGAKADIYKMLHRLAEQGVGVIVISDDLAEIVQNCNKIIVMRGGAIEVELNNQDTDETALSEILSGKAEQECV